MLDWTSDRCRNRRTWWLLAVMDAKAAQHGGSLARTMNRDLSPVGTCCERGLTVAPWSLVRLAATQRGALRFWIGHAAGGNDSWQRLHEYEPMNVANPTHSSPEKFTTRQPWSLGRGGLEATQDWVLLPAGNSPLHRDTRSVRVRDYCFFQVVEG